MNGNYFDDTCSKLSNDMKKLVGETNADNWEGIHPHLGNGELPGGSKDGIKSKTEFEVASVSTHAAACVLTDATSNSVLLLMPSLLPPGNSPLPRCG